MINKNEKVIIMPIGYKTRICIFDRWGSDDEGNVVATVQPFAQSPALELDWQRREETVLSRSGSV